MNFDQTQQVLNRVPEHKRGPKLRKTVLGVVFIALGVLLEKWFPGLSDWVLIGLVGFGGYCLAGDIMRNAIPFAVAAIKDIKAALKNGT